MARLELKSLGKSYLIKDCKNPFDSPISRKVSYGYINLELYDDDIINMIDVGELTSIMDGCLESIHKCIERAKTENYNLTIDGDGQIRREEDS